MKAATESTIALAKALRIAGTAAEKINAAAGIEATEPYQGKLWGTPAIKFAVSGPNGSCTVVTFHDRFEIHARGLLQRVYRYSELTRITQRLFGCGCPAPDDTPTCPVCQGAI